MTKDYNAVSFVPISVIIIIPFAIICAVLVFKYFVAIYKNWEEFTVDLDDPDK